MLKFSWQPAKVADGHRHGMRTCLHLETHLIHLYVWNPGVLSQRQESTKPGFVAVCLPGKYSVHAEVAPCSGGHTPG